MVVSCDADVIYIIVHNNVYWFQLNISNHTVSGQHHCFGLNHNNIEICLLSIGEYQNI